ncbi:hypothetical protein ARTSIC4J27_971 [Pseudarthrobacter siccitolerans]|uniref:Uncharacterized protein n=1 Tax=Pseudarthrobacter siccitolerans TaxID=861266 RepID=A0A024GZW7_9MICC|nr:hypothetical protein ARTSIC4J27_971 [Pseudarthrobacter siccitolerans]
MAVGWQGWEPSAEPRIGLPAGMETPTGLSSVIETRQALVV